MNTDTKRTLKLIDAKTEPMPERLHTEGQDVVIASGNSVILVIEHDGGWVSLCYSPDEARDLASAIATAADRSES